VEREEAILPFSVFVLESAYSNGGMPMLRIALVTALALAAVSPAQALKLTNRDATEQKMTIQENNSAREQTLKPSETMEGFCNSGCTIQMQDGEEYEFDGNEVVSIEEGLMFLDEAEQGSAPPPKQ
jgi:hypothetical protein